MKEEGLLPKEAGNYRYSASPDTACCGICRNFQPDDSAQPWQGGSCSVLEGPVRQVDVCDFFEPNGKKIKFPPKAYQPGGLTEAKKAFTRSYDEVSGDDSKFPEPVDAWTTTEDEEPDDDETDPEGYGIPMKDIIEPWGSNKGQYRGDGFSAAAHQHAAAAVEALAEQGWKPSGRSALKWTNPRLPGHEIEIEKNLWRHKIENLVHYQGDHSKLAGHVRLMSGIHRKVEALNGFNRVYED